MDGRDHASVRSKVKTDRYRRLRHDDTTWCEQFYPRSSVHPGYQICSLCFLLRSPGSPTRAVRRTSPRSESPSDSRISRVRVGRDESGAIGRPDVARDRPATKKKVTRNRGGYIIRNATFFSDGRDVITAPCEPSRITNSEGRDDDRDEKTSPPR